MSDQQQDEQRNREREKIVEDRPQMRSVAMMPAAPGGIASSGSIPSMPKPSRMFGAGPSLAYSKPEPAYKQQPIIVTSDSVSVNSGCTWKFRSLNPLPEFYCLERTHVIVSDATDVQVISTRISECLQRESIAATVNEEQASIKCETRDGVHFYINLFDSERGVIVEAQRSCGCSYLYCQAAKAVLRAARAMPSPVAKATTPQRRGMRCMPLPRSIPRMTSADREGDIREGLSIASGMLTQTNRFDSQVMALESLAQMTSTSNDSKHIAAKRILQKDGDFCQSLTSIILTYNVLPTSSMESDMEREHKKVMRHGALEVLANCVEALEESGDLSDVSFHDDATLLALLNDMSECRKRPHDACDAVRTLTVLAKSSRISKSMVPVHSLAMASSEGLNRHAQLYDATLQLELQL